VGRPKVKKVVVPMNMKDCLIRHTTNIFQVLDLSFFGGFTTKEKFWMGQDDDQTITATIHKLIPQFHSVATPENIRESFIRAGFSYSTGAIPYVLEFSRERMMESAGFLRVWELGVPWKICRYPGRRRSSDSSMRQVSSVLTQKKSEFNQAIARKSRISEFVYCCFFTR
jgi:hypothetical protein